MTAMTAVSPIRRLARRAPLLLLALLATGCAGSTVGAGVAPKLLRRPPYYAGNTPAPGARLAHLPIVLAASRDPGDDDVATAPGSPAASLLGQLNAHLDSIVESVRLQPVSAQPAASPDVSFECEKQGGDECLEAAANRGNMMLEVTRPSAAWVRWAGTEVARVEADALLLITLELADYWPRTSGILSRKEVELGTGYTQDLPWLTAMDRPVQVLQLTGALIGRDGKAIRIGAEGLLAKRTRLLAGAFGIRELLSDADVARLATLRREDLPDQPLVWQAALRNLVTNLTGQIR